VNLQKVLENHPEEDHDAVMKAIMEGQYVDKLWNSPEGRAIAQSFVKQISRNVMEIVELSASDPPRFHGIIERGREIRFCIKSLQRVEDMIDTKNKLIEQGD